jgi:Protein of unknown function (DUF2958)
LISLGALKSPALQAFIFENVAWIGGFSGFHLLFLGIAFAIIPMTLTSFLTDEQSAQLRLNGAARAAGQSIDPYPVVKLYTLDAGAAWLLTELDPDGDQAFGLCDAGTGSPELGHVSLSALQKVRGPSGLRIVADPHFKPRQPLSAYLADAQRDGSIND